MAIFHGGDYKRPLLIPWTVGYFLSLSSIVDLELACSPSPFLPYFLHLFEGKVRADLDLYFHQSISSLSEGT
jgi:hypothetical protein